MLYLSVYPFVAALPLQLGDEGLDEDENTLKPSKSKSERSSKRKKVPKPEKRKAPHSPEATPDETQETATEHTISPFLSIGISYISKNGAEPKFRSAA